MKWSEYLGEDYERGRILAYEGEPYEVDSLTLEPRIIQYEHEESVMGIEMKILCGEVELTRGTYWGLGFEGDPNDPVNSTFLDEVCRGMELQGLLQAHKKIRLVVAAAEERLKSLRETRKIMSVVQLTHEESHIRLSLDMARQVLWMKMRDKARASIIPFRLHLESPEVAIVFDDRNRVMGRIGFNPTVEAYRTTEGRFGVYNLPDDPSSQNGGK